MREFELAPFYGATTTLLKIRDTLDRDRSNWQSEIDDSSLSIYDFRIQARPFVLTELRRVQDAAQQLGAKITKNAVDEFIDALNSETFVSYEALFSAIDEIDSLLHRELPTILLLSLANGASSLYKPDKPLFGHEVHANFESTRFDIAEAGKCLALGRGTACAAHVMRVLEVALCVMAKAVGAPYDRANWHTLIDGIESRINAISAITHGTNWREQRDFFSEAAIHFRHLKDGWRNHIMHARQTYNDEQAEVVFTSVRAFMRQLAHKLKE